MDYLKQVVAYSCSWFYNDKNPVQQLFELSQKNLRAIDPSIIGESRYDAKDYLIVKVYKTIYYFLLGQIYFWCFQETVRTWAARQDVLKWAATQDPRCLERLPFKNVSAKVTREKEEDMRDVLIDRVCIPELGFKEDERENLQGLLRLCPGEIESFNFSQRTRKFRLAFKDSWNLTFDWDKIVKDVPKFPLKPGIQGVHLDLKAIAIRVEKV